MKICKHPPLCAGLLTPVGTLSCPAASLTFLENTRDDNPKSLSIRNTSTSSLKSAKPAASTLKRTAWEYHPQNGYYFGICLTFSFFLTYLTHEKWPNCVIHTSCNVLSLYLPCRLHSRIRKHVGIWLDCHELHRLHRVAHQVIDWGPWNVYVMCIAGYWLEP